MTIALSILIMLLILTLLVIVHEWGHYIAARIFGVKVNEFSIFMGPKLFQRVGKKTGTVFTIRCPSSWRLLCNGGGGNYRRYRRRIL